MKMNTRNLGSSTLFGMMLITTMLEAQNATESVTKTTTSVGTISEFSPQTMIIKTETALEPIRYSYTKSTTYVDENGQPVSIETVKSGLPVTVYYVKDGNQMIVTKVIVRKVAPAIPVTPVVQQTKTTTTTTTDK